MSSATPVKEAPRSPDQSYRRVDSPVSISRQELIDKERTKFVESSIAPTNPMEFRCPTRDVQTNCESVHRIFEEAKKA